MGKLLKFVGIVGLAAGVAALTTIVMSDSEVRVKVVDAAVKVKKAVCEVADTVAAGVDQARKEGGMSAVEKNQAWVDEQWEAIGI